MQCIHIQQTLCIDNWHIYSTGKNRNKNRILDIVNGRLVLKSEVCSFSSRSLYWSVVCQMLRHRWSNNRECALSQKLFILCICWSQFGRVSYFLLMEAFYLHHWEIGWANFSDFVTVLTHSDFPENRIKLECVLEFCFRRIPVAFEIFRIAFCLW